MAKARQFSCCKRSARRVQRLPTLGYVGKLAQIKRQFLWMKLVQTKLSTPQNRKRTLPDMLPTN